MRLWSLHPEYLDRSWILAVWREWLLAQAVLAWNTRWYLRHPQLERFRASSDPIGAIGAYLSAVSDEASNRGYRFDRSKILRVGSEPLPLNDGQLEYERRWLLSKLERRDPARRERLLAVPIRHHPVFVLKPGPIEGWEKIRPVASL